MIAELDYSSIYLTYSIAWGAVFLSLPVGRRFLAEFHRVPKIERRLTRRVGLQSGKAGSSLA